ncbi:hypothetical protein L5515_015646 [Caenorhabditis briggsae]|uniref:Uncharacterized protein n=1 Tax=Caenorhabditis briggsae TaxID=6238 RepID=A0AAE9EHV1_CAEBR|nr:hypothetical protein L5515_015646 [Caenorhabditis briggsae]
MSVCRKHSRSAACTKEMGATCERDPPKFCRIPPSCVSINRMRLSFVLGCQNAVPWCYTIQLLELDSKLI